MAKMHCRLITFVLLVAVHDIACSGIGYHYDRPTKAPQPGYHARNGFLPISTVSPLPPLPALPALPTPRPSHIQTHTQIVHTAPQQAQRPKSIAAAYYHPQAQYVPPTGGAYLNHPQQQLPQYHQRPQQQQYAPQYYNQNSFGLTAPSAPAANNAQLHTAIHYPVTAPESSLLSANGRRPLKQYAVIEEIENDIEQDTGPFLNSTPFIDSFRARVGASGTGAAPPPIVGNGRQIESRANSVVLEQQRLSANFRPAPGDAVALGSGGLGFVRLANGNIYLGSGSLGYISGKQHYQSVNEARTRTGAATPDALHFGHGPYSSFVNNALGRYK